MKTLNVEGQLMVLMANRYILPAALKYQKDVAESVKAVKDAGGSAKEAKKVLDRVTGLVDDLRTRTEKLEKALDGARVERREARQAHARRRRAGDERPARDRRPARETRAARLWPLPTYREMLFIK